MVRVRFAPSPTGYLHVGGARTALFNWLFARRLGGVLVLRIEDTDTERSSWEMVAGIVDGLRWLGLDWDEGPDIGGPHVPYFQSERLDGHRARAGRLVREGLAYYCYCTPAQLQEKRAAAEAAGGGWVYDRTCCALTPADVERLEAAATPRAVRFRVPEGQTAFTDLIHGPVVFENAHIEDFVILRSDGQPTYHLSVVADDLDMAITHVVRGDDHVSNTPKHVLLFKAFGAALPQFAHVPLILGTDKKRLSKRHGATSVLEYARLGYLAEAMINFLALLGWSPGSDEELFTKAELVDRFSLEGIGGGNAVFNPDKLDWFNQQHMMRLPAGDLADRLAPRLREAGLWRDSFVSTDRAWLERVIELLKPRARKLGQFVDDGRLFFVEDVEYDLAAVRKFVQPEGIRDHLTALRTAFEAVMPFEAAPLEATLRELADARGVKPAALIHATRVAVTGKAVSPGLFEVLELVGRTLTDRRLGAVLALAAPA
jgi:glutamyl-tRNA synthetase